MKQPKLSDEAFLKDVAAAPGDAHLFHLWWLGQSGFLVKWKNHHLLFDPYLSDSLTQKYADTDKPHVRMTTRVVSPDRLDFIEVVTSSHNHTDHLDADTLNSLRRVNPNLKLIVPEANRQVVADRLGCELEWPIGLDDGEETTVSVFVIKAVPAAHEKLERDEKGRCKYLGYLVRFGGWSIYHSGDTVRYEGMLERLQAHSIDVAILPTNGRKPERRVPGNLSGEEAAALAKEAGIRLVIPCHYDMFQFNTVSPEAFMAAAERLGQPFKVLENGERWSSTELE